MWINGRIWFFAVLFFYGAQVQAQEKIEVEPFDRVAVSGQVDLKLRHGSKEEVKLFVEGMPADKVKIKVVKGILRIQVINGFLYEGEIVKAYVTYDRLKGVKASAGARVRSDKKLKGDELEVKSISGAEVELEVDTDFLRVLVSEGGMLELEGRCKTQYANAATGGRYEGYHMKSDETFAKSSMGGVLLVHATEAIDAGVNMGGEVYYRGKPGKVTTKKSFGGAISGN